MTSSTPHTFIDIFAAKPADSDDITIKGIEIPIIQRDYAQGRENDDVNRIRKRFIDALKHSLTEDDPITLDFIYGEIDSYGNLIPLDGQQRLTTLFLLHWYVSKHEGIDEDKCSFLRNFTYNTRYSAREFCKMLSDYLPDFRANILSEDILDQSWFPIDWKSDPTIASMLVMIDTIHLQFSDIYGLWEKLENRYITFYFLPLKEMGLNEELYLKMNSRGKPLTQFEHFKAELEGSMKAVDKNLIDIVSHKIDLEWTDMLWPYKGENQIIDDEFIRYFHFICDIINYKAEQPLIDDPFDMVQRLFSQSNPDAKCHLQYVEKLFDCWCTFDNDYSIDVFFDKYLTTGEHQEKKSIVGKTTNLFLDCCNVYGEMQGSRIRRFPIGRTILLYAFILYLLNKDFITEDDFIRRIRIINNLVRASEFELRDDRMKALLAQTDNIIIHGIIEEDDKSFNLNQIKEEIAKNNWLKDHPEDEMIIREAEDHKLLNGAIRVLGVSNMSLYPKFKQLFDCDWDLVDSVLLATGDYSRFVRWRYQIGSSKIDSVWRDIFNSSEEEQKNTKEVLIKLLSKSEHFDNEVLKEIIKGYLDTKTTFDWRYYFIKYKSMRPGRYGMYVWQNEGTYGKHSRIIYMMTTEKSVSGYNYNVFLKTLYDTLQPKIPDLYLGNFAYQHDGDKLIIGNGSNKAISCDDSCFTVYAIMPDNSYQKINTVGIPQDPETGDDAKDRIIIGLELIDSMYSGCSLYY